MDSEIVTVELDANNSVKIHPFGATVISWICKGQEKLFVSSLSKMDGSKAVRGGIPVVFPNFGPWANGPQHGFARISWWTVAETSKQESNGCASIELHLKDNETTRTMWNHGFLLKYKVGIAKNELTTELSITNTGTDEFDFTTLLHTYLKVPDISTTTVTGFDGCLYHDKVAGVDNLKEERKEIVISQNVDAVYKNAGNVGGHLISTPVGNMRIEKHNLPDTVLWNPWSEKAMAMSDFDNEGYKRMICVEAGFVSERKLLSPNEVFTCSQKLISCGSAAI